jgi:hypothetical protein
MAEALGAHAQVRLPNDVVLNQVLVQFVPLDGDPRDPGAFTDAVVAGVRREGTCWMGGTEWRGRRAARISIWNWSTGESDVDCWAAAIARVTDGVNGEAGGGRGR